MNKAAEMSDESNFIIIGSLKAFRWSRTEMYFTHKVETMVPTFYFHSDIYFK